MKKFKQCLHQKMSLRPIKKLPELSCSCLGIISLTLLVLCSGTSEAQVSITLGAQEIYDDNIFLEDTNGRQVPVLFDSQIADQYNAQQIANLFSDRTDGKTDSDFITNTFIGFSGNLRALEPALQNSYDLQVGALFFADYTEQNRITLDANLETNLSKDLLPEPYYAGIRNSVVSFANNLAAPGGTATQNVQNYIFAGDLGIRRAALTRDLLYSMGYSGSYQKFLGEFFLNSADSSNQIKQAGVDFHSHTGSTGLDYQVNRDLELGLRGTGGVQLFTDIEPGDYGASELETSDLDRINAEFQGTTKYNISRTLFFDGSAGLGYSKLKNSPEAREYSFIDESGEVFTELRTPKDSNTGLTYSLALNYAYRPGSLATIGATRGFSTNQDGSRFTTQVGFINLSEPLSEDFRLVLGGSYMQFEDQSGISPDFSRFEGSASLNYHVSEATAFVFGYNYTRQTSDGAENLRIGIPGSQEFDANRIFVGINTGFVGLPL